MSALRKFHIPAPGAILVLLAFFLPWMSVGCEGLLSVEASGYDLASGNLFSELDSLLGGGGAPVDPGLFRVLWLVPAAAVLSLALLLVTMRRPESESRTGIGHFVAGLAGFAALAYLWLQTRGNAGGELSAITDQLVKLKVGVWLTVAGLLIILVGGILSYFESRRVESYGAYPSVTQTTPSGGYSPPGGMMNAGQATIDNAPRSMSSPTTANDPFNPVNPAAPRRATEVLEKGEPTEMAWLVIKEGPRAGHSFRLMETTSIGRDAGNDIIIDDSSLSGQHAKVKLENGDQFTITDLASTNGMFIFDSKKNDWEKVYRVELNDGTQVKLGRTVLHFMTLAGKEASDQAAAALD